MGILTEGGARPAKKARIAPTKGTKSRARSPLPKGSGKAAPPPTREEKHEVSSKSKGKAKATTSDEAAPPPLPTSFKVVAGSYEKLLYGLEGTVSLADPETSTRKYKFDLKPLFIFPAHVSCIKAVAASPQGGKWLATGSADEIIKVWDLRRRKEIGGLMHHEGAFTFPISPQPHPLLPFANAHLFQAPSPTSPSPLAPTSSPPPRTAPSPSSARATGSSCALSEGIRAVSTALRHTPRARLH